MREVGIKELKAHASEIVRRVSEDRARYVVSRRGKPVAVLVPVDSGEARDTPEPRDSRDAVEELLRLGHEATKDWQSEKTAVEMISEMRR